MRNMWVVKDDKGREWAAFVQEGDADEYIHNAELPPDGYGNEVEDLVKVLCLVVIVDFDKLIEEGKVTNDGTT